MLPSLLTSRGLTDTRRVACSASYTVDKAQVPLSSEFLADSLRPRFLPGGEAAT